MISKSKLQLKRKVGGSGLIPTSRGRGTHLPGHVWEGKTGLRVMRTNPQQAVGHPSGDGIKIKVRCEIEYLW